MPTALTVLTDLSAEYNITILPPITSIFVSIFIKFVSILIKFVILLVIFLPAGRVEGLVAIRYTDGSTYEGPYVSDSCLDLQGQVGLVVGRLLGVNYHNNPNYCDYCGYVEVVYVFFIFWY